MRPADLIGSEVKRCMVVSAQCSRPAHIEARWRRGVEASHWAASLHIAAACRRHPRWPPIHILRFYERLATGTMPKGSDREILGGFLGLMFVRTPTMRRIMAQVQKWGLETQLSATAQNPRAFAGLLKRFEADGIDISDPEFIRKSLTDMSYSDLILPKEYVLHGVRSARKFADIFLQMKWSVALAKHHYFITCDNPIYRAIDPKSHDGIYGDGGLLNETAQISFPVSTKRLLLLTWKGSWRSEFELRREHVAAQNRRRAFAAERELYAHIRHKALVKLAVSFKDKRPQIRADSLAGAKGFGKVVVPRRWTKN